MLNFRKSFMVAVVVLTSLLVASVASASVTVTVTPSGAKTALATTGLKLVIAGTSGSSALDCTGASFSGTVGSATGSGYPIRIGTLSSAITGCTWPGGLAIDLSCPGVSLNVTGPTVSGVTPESLTAVACTMAVHSMPTCRTTIAGAFGGDRFSNTTGQLTITASGQSLVSIGSTCASTLLNGAATFSSPTGGDLVFNVTPATTVSAP